MGMQSLIAAFKYLTVWGQINVIQPTPSSIGSGAVYFPLVGIALGNIPVSACTAGDANFSGTVEINEIIGAVNKALSGCG